MEVLMSIKNLLQIMICLMILTMFRILGDKSTEIFSKKSVFGGMVLFHFLSAIPCLIGSLLGILSQKMNPDQWWDFFLNNFPRDDVGNYMLYCLDTSTYKGHNAYNLCYFAGVILGCWNANIFLASIIIEFLIYVFIVFGGSFYVYFCLKRKTNTTNKDYSYERKLIVALFVQVYPYIVFEVCLCVGN
jgi:hypothetical protein